MKMECYVQEYSELLEKLSETTYFGGYSVTYHITKPETKPLGIGLFYRGNRLKYARNVEPKDYIDVLPEEHPPTCGGVTESITKFKLARHLKKNIDELKLFGDANDIEYEDFTDEQLAFVMYEYDVRYRSGRGYTPEILAHSDLIINKAILLADIAFNLILKAFPVIKHIDFHPEGHVMHKGKLAIKGDSDLLINNCLIDFKTNKTHKLSSNEGAQLFAYSINKYMRDGKPYDKVFILNPRYSIFEELVK